MFKFTQGKISKPQKVVIYGSEGIGKTTLAAQFPDPMFFDMEGGTNHFEVKRIERPDTWMDFITDLQGVYNSDFCKTIVIDTADWLEQLCVQHICTKNKVAGIESFGYGKGYTYLEEEWQEMLEWCNKAIEHGKNVVFTAHAMMRKFEQPDEAGAYDRYELKLKKKCSPLLKEWADALLFCNYKTYVVSTESGTKKAQGGQRVIYTSHHPCWDAKNRWGLPSEIPMEYSQIAPHIDSQTSPVADIKQDAPADPSEVKPIVDPIPSGIAKLLASSNINENQLREYIAFRKWAESRDPWASMNPKMLTAIEQGWSKVCSEINANPGKFDLPF